MRAVPMTVDLGASNVRIIGANIDDETESATFSVIHRAPNEPLRHGSALRWNVPALVDEVEFGLAKARRAHGDILVSVTSWGVDYGLVGPGGELRGPPVHYRDPARDNAYRALLEEVDHADLFAKTGVIPSPINSVNQLAADHRQSALDDVDHFLLIADLIVYHLTGVVGAEPTIASTTQLLDPHVMQWNWDLVAQLGLPARIFPPLHERLRPVIARAHRATVAGSEASVVLAGAPAHDTACAVAAVPATGPNFAFVACGTSALVGVENDTPAVSLRARCAGVTNERGVGSTVRTLMNLNGLWLLQECLRAWGMRSDHELERLFAATTREPPLAGLVDIHDARLVKGGGDMPARVVDCATGVRPIRPDPSAILRTVLDSLAVAFANAVEDIAQVATREVRVVHLVGGGARNELLCRATAAACDLPVTAGPAEATAIGSLLLQSQPADRTDLAVLRRIVRRSVAITLHEPDGERSAWRAARAQVRDIRSYPRSTTTASGEV